VVEPAQSEESLLGHLLTHGGGVPDDELIPVLTETFFVLRRDFDLTGDGVAEIFLTLSEDRQRTVGNRWRVYRGGESTTASARFLGTVSFHPDHVRVTSPNTLRVRHRKDVGLSWLVDFHWTGSEFKEVQRQEFQDEDAALDPELRAIKEFRESGAVVAAWAELTREGLGDWRDSASGEVLEGLAPIVSSELTLSSASRTEPKSLLSDLRDRLYLSCFLGRCELYLQLADLTGDGMPELLVDSSTYTGAPRLVYARAGEGYRFLGKLPLGPWRLDGDGRIAIVKSSPAELERYRATSEAITFVERVSLADGRATIDEERRRILAELADRDPAGSLYRVPWEEAAERPQAPPWVTFENREPANIEVDLSLPVVNPEAGGDSQS
jgi:hypothetical protein